MRLRHFFALLLALAGHGTAADTPPIAPAFLSAELLAIGHITGRAPQFGAGVGVGGCTGTLIAPTLFLTAAHCAAARAATPERLYVTFGWSSDGPPLWRGRASQVILYPEYTTESYGIETLHLDVALVILPRPVPQELVTPIPLAAGTQVESYGSFGYLAQAETLLRGQEGCHAVPLSDDGLWGFDCDVVQGFSGGPLIAQTADGPVVAAVAVAHAPGVQDGIRSFAVIPAPHLFPNGTYPN